MNIRTISLLPLVFGLTAFTALAADPFTHETRVYKKADNRELHVLIEKPAAWKPDDRRPCRSNLSISR